MMGDFYNVWSVRDLVITASVCLIATVWIFRNKSWREKVALILAGIVVVIANVCVIFIVRPERWRDRLPLYDILIWIATCVSVVFNRAIKRDKSKEGGELYRQN
jgi:Ca2+/Na+ antiporter